MRTFKEFLALQEARDPDPREFTSAWERRRGRFADYGRHLDPKSDPMPFHPTWEREPNPVGSKDSLPTYIGSQDEEKYKDITNVHFYKAMIDELALLSRHKELLDTEFTMEKLLRNPILKHLVPSSEDEWAYLWKYLKIAEKKRDLALTQKFIKVFNLPITRKIDKKPGMQVPGPESARGNIGAVSRFKHNPLDMPIVGTIPPSSEENPTLALNRMNLETLRRQLKSAVNERNDEKEGRKILKEIKRRAESGDKEAKKLLEKARVIPKYRNLM